MIPPLSGALVSRIKEEAGAYFRRARGSHDWDHTERVYRLCLRIGRKEKADLRILELAALLHDIGREEEDRSNGKICHGRTGAALAQVILERHGLDRASVRAVVHCIRTHRFRKRAVPRTLEARILFDADKLDSIGAVGVGRAFLFAGEVGARLHNSAAAARRAKDYGPGDTAYREWLVKLRRLPARLLTPAGRRLASDRAAFAAAFFARLDEEVAGKR